MWKPEKTEYHPFYGEYLAEMREKYPDAEPLGIMREQKATTAELLRMISVNKWDHRYDDGKWSVKEVVGHLIDIERLFGYRAMCISRGDKAAFPGLEENDYIGAGNYAERSLVDIAREFSAVRESNMIMFGFMAEEALTIVGNANGTKVTPRAIANILPAHEYHHIKVLKEKYLE